ncbi:DUF6904 family protein [Evansella tamaricis]|uniref:Uncharacterized protein n=1 Tax=Evansella tamaricis TaxID=2069301 RepID=A0ABS6JEB3_9BACI|nr:hypothetical protein [Evansella tamaricis]MBU9711187.1 hypothetical protein [Evansella tamaricis]
MIVAKNTPNNTGIAVYGDYIDFENLYEALHDIVGEEGEFTGYDSARIRILGVCYDLRHALMGNREYEFMENGLDEDKKKRLNVLAPDKNMYLKIYVLWPEMLFVMIALNDFLEQYAKRMVKNKYSLNLFSEPKVSWNKTVAQIKMLQAAVSECLKDTLSENAYARLLNVMNGNYVFTDRYLTQYIDHLNDKFMDMTNDKRLKNISTFAKRIAEKDKEYRALERDLQEEAKRRNCNVNDLRLAIDYPEEIDW